jgi:hypothetical protein
MVRNITGAIALLTVGLLAGCLMSCGVSSDGLEGSKHDTMTGVAPSGYPHSDTQSNDPGSPALSSSSESKYSRDQMEAAKEGKEAR